MKVEKRPFRTNFPPSFSSEFPSEVTIHKTESPLAWSLRLPSTVDLNEEDVVSVTASLGRTALFVHFDAERNTLSISDLSNSTVLEGSYEDLKVTLNDSYD